MYDFKTRFKDFPRAAELCDHLRHVFYNHCIIGKQVLLLMYRLNLCLNVWLLVVASTIHYAVWHTSDVLNVFGIRILSLALMNTL